MKLSTASFDQLATAAQQYGYMGYATINSFGVETLRTALIGLVNSMDSRYRMTQAEQEAWEKMTICSKMKVRPVSVRNDYRGYQFDRVKSGIRLTSPSGRVQFQEFSCVTGAQAAIDCALAY